MVKYRTRRSEAISDERGNSALPLISSGTSNFRLNTNVPGSRPSRGESLQKATKEAKVVIYDFENLRYLRFLLLVLVANGFEGAVF